MAAAPRITPGTRKQLGLINFAIAKLAGLATGGTPPNLFTTLGRHRGLFLRWLPFAGGLMPGGKLPRRDTELVILRVAGLTSCEYERSHHVPLARKAGLTLEQVDAVEGWEDAACWTPRQAAILRAVDELHTSHDLSDETWAELSAQLSEVERIELCVLVGHYGMLAMFLNAARVQPDAHTAERVLR